MGLLHAAARNGTSPTLQERMELLHAAARNGTLEDAFGAGTAATIAQILIIGFRDERLELPPLEGRTLSNKIKNYLSDIKTGKAEDIHSWNFKV